MNKLLNDLLEAHARQGGSVILLSATLPQQMRESLVTAFHQGLGEDSPQLIKEKEYPLITHTPAVNEIEKAVESQAPHFNSLNLQLGYRYNTESAAASIERKLDISLYKPQYEVGCYLPVEPLADKTWLLGKLSDTEYTLLTGPNSTNWKNIGLKTISEGRDFHSHRSWFKQAGIEAAFKLKPLPLYRRVLEQINTGEIDLSAHPMWEHDYNPDFALKSDPVLGRDDSVKLLYTRKNHPTLFGAKTAQDFKELNSATNATWDLDLALLHCITSSVIKTRNYEEIYKVVGSGRADMTLDYPIATDDGSKTFGDVTLYPVPDYKVSMNQEQYFFISKQSKNAQIIRTVLNNGIRNLRENNIITNTYTRAGYINNKVKDWQFLRCHQ